MFKLKNLFSTKNKKNFQNNFSYSLLRNFSTKKIFFNDHLLNNLQKNEKKIEIKSMKFKISEKNFENFKNFKIKFFLDEKNFDKNFNEEDNKKNFAEIFHFEEEENFMNFELKNFAEISEVKIPLRKNLYFELFFVKNLKIFSDLNEGNLFDKEINLDNEINFSLENSSVELMNTFLVKNLKIDLKNSEFINKGEIISYNKKLLGNFKDFENGFDRNLLGLENIENNNTNTNKNNNTPKEIEISPLTKLNNFKFDIKERNISIKAINSTININYIKNFSCLKIESNKDTNNDIIEINDINDSNNNISINKLSLNKFEFNILEGDKININLFHVTENSLFKLNKFNTDFIKFKIHPLLIFNLNVYNLFNNKFQKQLFFDNEGYSFCPTILFDIDRQIPKNFLVGYNLISLPKIISKILKIFMLLFLIKIFFLCENNSENLLDNETNFNTLNNLNNDITEYKMYQMLMKQKLNNFLNDNYYKDKLNK